jgi:hypothetical protein
MSALGQKQTSDWHPFMSALPPKADIAECDWDVRFVPQADMPCCGAENETITNITRGPVWCQFETQASLMSDFHRVCARK